MTALTEYLEKRDNLLPTSASITLAILLLIFIVAQFLAYRSFLEKEDIFKVKMEVRELVKLKFSQNPTVSPEKSQRAKADDAPKAKVSKEDQPDAKPVQKAPDVAALIKDIDTRKFISPTKSSRHKVSTPTTSQTMAIATDAESPLHGITANDFKTDFSTQPSTRPSGRRGSPGGATGPTVQVGAASGAGTISSVNGSAIAGRASSRTTRRAGTGTGGAKIGLPNATGGGDASIDLNALIEWMKKHPGPIPKLVAYEMGHQGSDLSSAVSFVVNGRNYKLFLSCNELELLLRICLVDADDYTLLKDNGIKEESNFLTMGDVVRNGEQIQSLISSRQAPGDKAASFYGIFWGWWQKQQK